MENNNKEGHAHIQNVTYNVLSRWNKTYAKGYAMVTFRGVE